ncbi:MAG: ComEC/Rec2 family competence protein [Chitinivibrionales bacterium]
MRLPSSTQHPRLFNRSITHQAALWAWIALSVGIVLGDFTLATCSPPRLYNGFWTSAIVFTLIAGLLCSQWFLPRIFIFTITGMLVMTTSGIRGREFESDVLQGQSRIPHVCIQGKSVGQSVPLLNVYRTVVSASVLTCSHGSHTLDGENVRCYSKKPIPQAATVRLYGTFRKPSARYFPAGFDSRRHYRATNTVGSFDVDSVQIVRRNESVFNWASISFRTYVKNLLARSPNPTQTAILGASFLGEKHYLAEDIKFLFRDAGIFHLLAISGLHMGILVLSTFTILSLVPVDRRCKILITLAVVWIYVLFIGAIPSLVRAAIMATVLLLTFLVQRRQYPLNTLGIAGCIWLLYSPHSLFSPGYQLSFAATTAIIAAQPVMQNILRRVPPMYFRKPLQNALGSFLVSTAGFIGTAPVLYYHFGSVSIVGLITNTASVFMMSLGMHLFFVAVCLFWISPAASSFVLTVVSYPLSAVISLAEMTTTLKSRSLLPSLPCGVWIIYLLCFLGLISLHPKRVGQYLRWTPPVLLLLAGAILLMRKNCDYTDVFLFNAGSRNLAGIDFPNGRRWLIGSADPRRWEYAHRNRLLPWQRDRLRMRLETIILPRLESNAAHFLSPILENSTPKNLITDAHEPISPLADREFSSLLTKNEMSGIRIESAASLYPSEGCSVLVESSQTGTGLSIDMNLYGFHILLLPSFFTGSGWNADTLQFGIPIFTDSHIDSSSIPGASDLDLTEGAARFRFFTDGRMQVHQYRGSRWR